MSSAMSIGSIAFKTKTASKQAVLSHLSECDDSFVPPLSSKVDLVIYSKKLVEEAITFEAWHGGKLAGLIAAYFNGNDKRTGYITNVSILPEFTGMGIGSQLLLNCMNYAVKEGYYEIRLEVNKLNVKAISLYKNNNFVQMDEKDDDIIMNWNRESKTNCRIVINPPG